jgi:GDP-mannose 6-dehydrogenase
MYNEGSATSQIAVFGLGYVGCVTAACLSNLGHKVVGVDQDDFKVRSVNEHRAPFYEPGLEELIRKNVEAGRLWATTSSREALLDANVVLIAVGTPSEKNGNLGLSQLRRCAEDIAGIVPSLSKPLVIAIRSTVFPGTCDEVIAPLFRDFPHVDVVSNPEFLREGTAVRDFTDPALIVVGGSNPAAIQRVADLYAPLNIPPCLVSLRTAEMIKYACNAYHGVKVAFANEIGAICEKLGVSGQEVMSTFCQDTRLNISAAYLKPGFAFGGSCLPKDLRALVYRAGQFDLSLPLLESALPSNREHLARAIDAVMTSGAQRIGVFGLSFKENTDDLRESPAVAMLEQLIGKGRDLKVYDPHISMENIYGTNRNFVLNHIPHIGRLLEPDFESVAAWAECLLVTQKPTEAMRGVIENSGKPILDFAGVFSDNRIISHASR